MEKRYLVCVLALSFAVLFVGCGTKSEKSVEGQKTETTVTTAQAPEAGETKEANEAKSAETKKSSVDAVKIGYSADMVATTPAGEQTSKIAASGKDKVRMETMGQVVIVRRDKGKMWMLNPETKTGMEMPVNEEMLKDIEKGEVDKVKMKPVGTETVDGYVCDKYLVTSGGSKATTWLAKENGLPIKIESEGTTVKFKNIKVGKQPASLFEPDPGYKIQQMPDMSQMGGSMPKGMPVPPAPR